MEQWDAWKKTAFDGADRQTDIQTDGYCDLETELAKLDNSVKTQYSNKKQTDDRTMYVQI